MKLLKERLKELGVELVVYEMEKRGYYVPAWRKIFVNQNLSEEEMKQVIIHELKHVLDHSDYVSLYNTFSNHSKMETEANTYMVNYMIKENEGLYNYSELIENYDIRMGYELRFSK